MSLSAFRLSPVIAATALIAGALVLSVLSGPAMAAERGSNATDRYIVKFKPGQEFAAEREIRRQQGKLKRKLKKRRILAAQLSKKELQRLRKHNAVESVEIDPRRYLKATTLAQEVPWGVSAIGSADLSTFGTDRKVCVIDSGYEMDHPDLPKAGRVTGMAQEGTGSWSEPGDSHGTHVAGTIAALDNGEGVVGANTSAGLTLHIVKVFDDDGLWGYASDLIDAVDSCIEAGSNVISMSLGGGYPSAAEEEAFEEARSQNILSIAAAGNDGSGQASYPASYDVVVSVAAVDENLEVASFSQKNDQVELAAPGVSVNSTVLDGGYAAYSGTSMATPHVAAAAALVWGLHPTCSSEEIRAALARSAVDLGAEGRDNAYGFGFIQPAAADALFTVTGSCDVGGLPERPEPEIQELENGVPFENFSLAAGESRFFSVTVPEGVEQITVTTSGGPGDADLYVSYAEMPDISSYECRSWIIGNEERCSFEEASVGVYFVLMYGYTDATVESLMASFDAQEPEPEPNAPPSAVLIAEPIQGTAPLVVLLDGSESTDDTGIETFEWDLGDGTTASGVTAVEHTYEAPGEYQVTLTVTDAEGLADTALEVISVNEPNLPPEAVIEADATAVKPGQEIIFDGSGSSDADGYLIDFQWDLGDGSTDLGDTITHSYAEPGLYLVTLRVTDDAGAVSDATVEVTVEDDEVVEPPPAIELLVRWNFRGNRNILQWSGAETRRVKVFVEGRLRPIKTRNDGKFKTSRRLSGRSYQVCENRRNGDCSDVVPAP